MKFNLTIDSIEIIVSEILTRHTEESEFLTTPVSDGPTVLEDSTILLPKNDKDLIRLFTLLHFSKEVDRGKFILFSLEIESRISDPYLLRLWNKKFLTLFLFENYNKNSLFGLFERNTMRRLFKLIRFRKISKIVRKPQRKRGYADKGSMKRQDSLRVEESTHYMYHYEIQEKMKLKSDSIEFIEGYMT